MKDTIRYSLIGFGFSMVLLIFSATASLISIQRLIGSSDLVNQTNSTYIASENIISNMKDAETGVRGYLVTHDSKFLQPYNGAYERTMQSYSKLQELTSNRPDVQVKLDNLRIVIENRFQKFRELIAADKNADYGPMLTDGKIEMDKARAVITGLENDDRQRLEEQTSTLHRYTANTPTIVIISAILSLLVTIIAFLRIRADIKKRNELQVELQEAAVATQQRIAVITDIAQKISIGSYDARIGDKETGELGTLATALNQMASELETNFTKLEEQASLQKGIVDINDVLKGEKNIEKLANDTLVEIVQYLDSNVGIMYVAEDGNILKAQSSYAAGTGTRSHFHFGEGMVGQVAIDKKPLVINDVSSNMLRIDSGFMDGQPASVILYPLIYNEGLEGVIEIGAISGFPHVTMRYLESIAPNIAIAINTSRNRSVMEALLQETQVQAEELRVQQEDLQRSNTELESQTQKLQASEEELRVQQEELMHSNVDLEEKAQLLEEQNQFIEQKRIEALEFNTIVEEKNKQLEQASRYKSEFLANMSHELRTPLNSILLLAKVLSDKKYDSLGEERYEYAKVIHNSGMSLLELINEILDHSKIEAGQMQIQMEDILFKTIKDDLQALFAPVANDKKLAFTIDIDDRIPPVLQTDVQRLEQILKNLVSNAIKFTDAGAVSLSIEPAMVLDNNGNSMRGVLFVVKDSGIGIPPEHLGSIFDAFKQVDGSTKRKYGGTGLGLSISREISKLLGGQIKVESTPGTGSTFTLSLPLEQQDANPVAAQTAAPESAPVAENKNVAPGTRPDYVQVQVDDDRGNLKRFDKPILIVEDDMAFVKTLSMFVKTKGYKIIVATNGEEAVKLARQYLPMGILLDVMLPVMDGWSVIEELKKDESTRHIPVHVMSAVEARKKSLDLGAVEFIDKPMAEDKIDTALRKIEEVSKKKQRKVLIVEKDQKHAGAMAGYFKQSALQVVVSGKVEEAMSILEKGDIDCVVLDISVEDDIAFWIMKNLKDKPQFELLPVIIYTGPNITSEEEKLINRYSTTVIIKKADSYEKILSEVSIFLHIMGTSENHNKGRLTESILTGKKILIADDDPRNVFALTKALEQAKVEITSLTNGKEVLNYVEKKPKLDAILMDIMMPEMDGFETIAALRKMPEYKNIPIIAITAKAMHTDREKCIEAGASDYISKPVDLDQLISLLSVWLY